MKTNVQTPLTMLRTLGKTHTYIKPNINCIRYLYKDVSKEKPESSEPEEVQSAIVERMKQILEEKITIQSSSTLTTMKRADDSLNKILSKYDNSQHNINQANSYIKSEPLLAHNKHAKDIYNSQPWTGTESTYDSNLRMILDTTPKLKPPINPLNMSTSRKPSKNEKLAMARDVSLDYKINKKENPNHDDNDGFREMYKERLLGPSMLLSHNTHSIDFVENVAGNKINASINQTTGKFDGSEMNKVRGKPLDQDHLKNCTDSNYFMNQILKNQDVKPVWIENQHSLNRNIQEFRTRIDEMWFKWIIYNSDIAYIIQSATIVETIEDEFERNITRFSTMDEVKKLLNDSDLKYIETKIELLNQEIRNYNLQCPSVTGHKFKLQKDKEINEGYWRMLENFSNSIQTWFDKNKIKKKSKRVIMEYKDKQGGGFLGIWGDTARGTPHEIHENKEIDTKLHVWKAIKNVFTQK